jgi:hypothetical protein
MDVRRRGGRLCAVRVTAVVRWRGEARSALLLAGMVLSSLWAASAAGYVVNHAPAMWRTSVTFDVTRLAVSSVSSSCCAGEADGLPVGLDSPFPARLWSSS